LLGERRAGEDGGEADHGQRIPADEGKLLEQAEGVIGWRERPHESLPGEQGYPADGDEQAQHDVADPDEQPGDARPYAAHDDQIRS